MSEWRYDTYPAGTLEQLTGLLDLLGFDRYGRPILPDLKWVRSGHGRVETYRIMHPNTITETTLMVIRPYMPGMVRPNLEIPPYDLRLWWREYRFRELEGNRPLPAWDARKVTDLMRPVLDRIRDSRSMDWDLDAWLDAVDPTLLSTTDMKHALHVGEWEGYTVLESDGRIVAGPFGPRTAKRLLNRFNETRSMTASPMLLRA